MLPSGSLLRTISVVAFFILTAVGPQSTNAQELYTAVAPLKGIINPAAANYLDRVITEAETTGAGVVIIELDTPGGLDTSMRAIIQRMISARVPVVVYVAPSGARSGSAGVYITYAAQIAAMAPSTNIGSATPVSLGEGGEQQMSQEMRNKVTNDAVAYIKSLAQLRGRNADWAEKAVRDGANITSGEALELKVIDVVADDLPSLLEKIDKTTVSVGSGSAVLKTRDIPVRRMEMSPIEALLHTISDPTIAYLLLSLGTLAIVYELASPGAVLPGVVGGLFLILALFGLGTLPINLAGLLLMGFAFLLFVADVFAPTHGILTAGGIIAFVLGSFLLINTRDAPFLAVSTTAIATVTLGITAFFVFVVAAIVRSRRLKPTSGLSEMVGIAARAKTELNPGGLVFADGALWEALSESGNLPEGTEVMIVGQRGLTLLVKPSGTMSTATPQTS